MREAGSWGLDLGDTYGWVHKGTTEAAGEVCVCFSVAGSAGRGAEGRAAAHGCSLRSSFAEGEAWQRPSAARLSLSDSEAPCQGRVEEVE